MQGELAVLGARLDSVEEDNSELRAMVTELKEMVLAQGPSPVLPTAPNPSPTVTQSAGGAASSRQDGGAAGGLFGAIGGVAQGMTGLFIKPVVGMADGVSTALSAVQHEVQDDPLRAHTHIRPRTPHTRICLHVHGQRWNNRHHRDQRKRRCH